MNLSPLLNRNTQSIHFVFQFIIDRISSRLTHRIDVCIRIRPNVRIRATPVHKPQRILTRAAVQLDVQIAVTEVRELERRVVSAALVETGPRVVGAVGVDAPVGIQRRRRAVGVPFFELMDKPLENRTCDVNERGDNVTGDLNLASCWTLIRSTIGELFSVLTFAPPLGRLELDSRPATIRPAPAIPATSQRRAKQL